MLTCCECGDRIESDEGKAILADVNEAFGPLCEGCAEDTLDAVISAEADALERGDSYGDDPGGW